MEHHLEELDQIVLRGKSSGENTKTLVENQVSTEDLERFTSGSIGDALNGLSGVSSLNTGSTVIKPMINGLHSSRVVIINKGVRMEDQEWGAEHAPNIDINSVGRQPYFNQRGWCLTVQWRCCRWYYRGRGSNGPGIRQSVW